MNDGGHWFLAFWPPAGLLPGLEARMAAWQEAVWPTGLTMEVPTRWHLTLAFFGTLDAQRRQGLEQTLDALVPGPFPLDLRLDKIGRFKAGRVWWLGADQAPAALDGFRRSFLEAGGFPADDRFQPHMTVARLRRPWHAPERAAEPVLWHLDALTLVRSHAGVYHQERVWRFDGGVSRDGREHGRAATEGPERSPGAD